jgi:hypothetical protein
MPLLVGDKLGRCEFLVKPSARPRLADLYIAYHIVNDAAAEPSYLGRPEGGCP